MTRSHRRWFAPTIRIMPALFLAVSLGAFPSAQAPGGRGAPPSGSVAQPAGGRGQGGRTASQQPPPTVTPQAYPPAQVQAGQPLFSARCGFCHGRDAAGGETGPDLTRSVLVAEDVRGDKLIPVIREGRVDKGMPGFSLGASDFTAIVAFIHDQKIKAESQEGSRRSVDDADLQTGNADAGRQYFNGAGGCARCHSPTGDLAGVAGRFKGLALLQRMLYPSGGRSTGPPPAPATVTVTSRSGETVTGKLAYRDEFTIALTDQSGWYRSWPTSQVKASVNNPLDAHSDQLANYTDDDMHNVLAYLQTLR